MMAVAPKKTKQARVAPIEVDPAHQAMLLKLVETYGTYVHVVHKALDLLWKRDMGEAQSNNESSMTGS